LAHWLLGIPASEAPSERVFSVLSKISTKDRNRLSAKRVSQLMFLKCNRNLLAGLEKPNVQK